MSFMLILRLACMLVLALLGWEVGKLVANWMAPTATPTVVLYYRFIVIFIGAALGFFFGPYFTVIPYRALRSRLRQASARTLLMGVVGLVVGLVIAALLALPLSLLPGMLGEVLPLLMAILLGSLGATTMIVRDKDILTFASLVLTRDSSQRKGNMVLLDTSVIIDGRIADISQTGFICGDMLVPRFVLDELQHIADSADVLRRNRGRRGLEILNRLQKDSRVPFEISEMDAPEVREVDGKLIKLARQLNCPILTNDYNLNRVAELQGVRVLNINELANAVKSAVLPGETLRTQIIQEGKELGQGVGYLDDGTMIVVEDGKRYMNTTVEIVVTRVLQTVAGRMIFGQIQDGKR